MSDRVAILVVVDHHSLFGGIECRGLRVLDVMNDVNTDYLHLHDVAVRRGIQGDSVGKQLSEVTIPKSAVDFVLLESGKHEAPLRRQHSFVQKGSHEAFILLREYEIHGTFMHKGSCDVLPTLRQDNKAFVPVISPKLSRGQSADPPLSAGVALLNLQKISLLQFERT